MITIEWPDNTTNIKPIKKSKDEIKADFAEIARKHGLIWDNSSNQVRGSTQTLVVDILVGDDDLTSQILEEDVASIPVLTQKELDPIMIERNYLQIDRSIITMTTEDGLRIEYEYVGKSSLIDDQFTDRKRFLKLRDKLTGRIDIWNGILWPKEKIRYYQSHNSWIYSKVSFKIDDIKFQY